MPRKPQTSALVPRWVRFVRETSQLPAGVKMRAAADVARFVRPFAEQEEVECFWLLCLDRQHRARQVSLITRGVLDGSLVHPREVFRAAIAENAAAIVVVHNHPSGDPTPSAEDRAVTRQLAAAGDVLGIPLLDHVVVAGERFASLAQLGHLNKPPLGGIDR